MANDRELKHTIDSTKVSADVTYMPILLTRTEFDNETCSPTDSDAAKSDGGDLRVYKNTGASNELATDIVAFNHDTSDSAGDGEVQIWVSGSGWVVSSSADTDFYSQHGDAALTEYGVTDTYGRNNVYDSDYVGVWHLEEAGATSRVDSTGNGNTGTRTGDVTTRTGQIGNGNSFDGAGDYIECGDVSATEGAAELTVETWFLADTWTQQWLNLVGKRVPGGQGPFYMRRYNDADANENKLNFGIRNSSDTHGDAYSNSTISTATKYNAIGTYDGSTVALYLDGTAQTTTDSLTGNTDSTTEAFSIGRARVAESEYFDGWEDEVRVSTTARASGWITTQFNNQNSPSTFMSHGTSYAAGGITGTGAHQAVAATGSGIGERSITGSGTNQSVTAISSGVAERSVVGSGVNQSVTSVSSGVAERVIPGTGIGQAVTALSSGIAERVITGSGVNQASTSTSVGTGSGVVTGSGVNQAETATSTGTGSTSGAITGTGAHQSETSLSSGIGERLINGTGSHQASVSTSTGVALRIINGTGSNQASLASSSGVGLRLVKGTGVHQASAATSFGESGFGSLSVIENNVSVTVEEEFTVSATQTEEYAVGITQIKRYGVRA